MSTRLGDSKKSKKRVLPDTLGVMCNSVTWGKNLNQGRVNDISTSLQLCIAHGFISVVHMTQHKSRSVIQDVPWGAFSFRKVRRLHSKPPLLAPNFWVACQEPTRKRTSTAFLACLKRCMGGQLSKMTSSNYVGNTIFRSIPWAVLNTCKCLWPGCSNVFAEWKRHTRPPGWMLLALQLAFHILGQTFWLDRCGAMEIDQRKTNSGNSLSHRSGQTNAKSRRLQSLCKFVGQSRP